MTEFWSLSTMVINDDGSVVQAHYKPPAGFTVPDEWGEPIAEAFWPDGATPQNIAISQASLDAQGALYRDELS